MTMNFNQKPPRWPRNFLRWALRPDIIEEIEGDMEETYQDWLKHHSTRRAKCLYVLHAISLIRPSLIKSLVSMDLFFRWTMFSSYLKIGLRNFRKYKRYSLTNLLGLSIGFAASLLLVIIVKFERSFDDFHDSSQDIYRVASAWKEEGLSDMIVTPQVPLMVKEYPEIIGGTRFFQWEDIFQVEDHFIRSDFHFVDSQFVKVFDFSVLAGDLEKTLRTPNYLAVSQSMATKIFGGDEVVGNTLQMINDARTYVVGAVLLDPPRNSSIQFNILIPWINTPDLLSEEKMGNWYNTFMTGYVRLYPETSPQVLEEKLVAFKNRHFLEERKLNSEIVLLPLIEEHFRDSSGKRVLVILAIIAAAILLISCINFINLSLAQLAQRTREMGVRKVLGGSPNQIVYQFVCENLILCSLALVIGTTICYLLIPAVGRFLDYGIQWSVHENMWTLIFLLSSGLIAVVLASSWPALFLAYKKSVHLLKRELGWDSSGGMLRRSLMVMQFTVSIFLVIGTALIWRQIDFMQSRDLNFDGNHVATTEFYSDLFKVQENFPEKIKDLKRRLEQYSAIENATISNSVPGSYAQNYNGFSDVEQLEREVSLRQLTVDANFLRTFDMSLIHGRNFDPRLESDETAVVINQSAMEALGWESIADKYLQAGGDGSKHQVIGVVEDYFYQSLKEEIQPLIHFYHPEAEGVLAVRLAPDQLNAGLRAMEEEVSRLSPYEPFTFTFVDDDFDGLYKEQMRLRATASFFSCIAIILACLGLFSLAAYSIRLRKKEIGIRRVLGASVENIVMILVTRYSVLLLLGFVIACPLVYLVMYKFLDDFAHRITMQPLLFFCGGAAVITVSLVMLLLQSRLAAVENPSRSLRDE